jgi:glucuronoxylan 4-O-methyltransferase
MIDYKKYIKGMKRRGEGLMSRGQYLYIADELAKKSPCNLLVFGLGHDSYLWNLINENGRTIFIEDDEDWIDEISDGSLEVYSIKYSTKVSEWESINYDESKLQLDLPEEVAGEEWDFVIIDAPLGHSPPRPYKGPGRMSTIYNGYRLLKNGGVGVVDDMGRVVEREYAFHYFGKDKKSWSFY